MKRSTCEIVHRGLRYELMPVSMLIYAAVSFCLLLKEVELLILRPTRHTGVLLFHRAMSVRDRKARSRAILVFFGLTLFLLASDTPVLPSGADALDVLRAWILRRRGRCPSPLYLTYFGKALGRRKEERSPSQYVRTNVRRLMVS